MYWRQEKGDSWEKNKGAKNKKTFKSLVMEGKVHGALAYQDETPVGWINFDKRSDFAKLDRAPSFQCEDSEKVWSIPCFYIKAGFRGQGVATELLKFAVRKLRQIKAPVVEGYPVNIRKTDKSLSKGGRAPAAFVWTGTTNLFKDAGFKPVGSRKMGKQRMRLQ